MPVRTAGIYASSKSPLCSCASGAPNETEISHGDRRGKHAESLPQWGGWLHRVVRCSTRKSALGVGRGGGVGRDRGVGVGLGVPPTDGSLSVNASCWDVLLMATRPSHHEETCLVTIAEP